MMARLKEQEDENRRLKKMYAEERLKPKSLRKPWQKSGGASFRKQMAQDVVRHRNISVRFACRLIVVSESCYRYQAKLSKEIDVIANWLLRITNSQRNWGVGLCFLYLRNVKGFRFNHKRIYRIYCKLC